ncbi:hypothetical protein P4O66_019520 [Electrophorus voltai]|uniref:Uncharacterized protein n=2 Tax=Electrophorus TaxID=8004 RepID=A0A4W4ELF5_ELEEL|nr:uncharacterized protein C1orf109 homolog [Electrophorus electricus]KAK1805172.1 hypothetical protein P4O66_019520 [Electrophorus voltai]
MSQQPSSLLHQELRKCFRVLEANQNIWKSVLAECTPLMSSLGNLAEQLRALKNVELVNTPLAQFPDLKERLQYKLIQAIDTVLGKLSEKMYALQLVRDSISKQLLAVVQQYEQKADSLDIHSCTTRSAISPSVADMLEWFQDAERYYRVQYIQRKNLLQILKPDELVFMETAPKRWATLDSPRGEENISDVLHQVSFFMSSD